MEASCGCRVKSYRAKQCPHCRRWMCPSCYAEHMASLEVHCIEQKGEGDDSVLPRSR